MSDQIDTDHLIQEISRLKLQQRVDDALASRLIKAVESLTLREKQLNALMTGSQAVLQQHGFFEAAKTIFDLCKILSGPNQAMLPFLVKVEKKTKCFFLRLADCHAMWIRHCPCRFGA